MIDALAARTANTEPEPGSGPLPDEFVVVAEKDTDIRDAVLAVVQAAE